MYEVYVAARFEVIVRGQHLGEDGTLYDIGELGRAVVGLAGSMHYRDLNEVPGLAEVNTTAEMVASYCWDKLAEPLRGQGLDSLTVRIWESPDAYAARED